MERDEFIKSLGLGVALLCTGSCMTGCGKGGGADTPDPGNTNPPPGGGGSSTATVDLSTQLMAIGDQATANGVLFFRVAAGNAPASFVATESVCPHQGGSLMWKQASSRIQCQLHSSEYSTAGAVLQGPQNSSGSTRALKIYTTAISGTKLTATIA
jgi:Rieske Fe-S protein